MKKLCLLLIISGMFNSYYAQKRLIYFANRVIDANYMTMALTNYGTADAYIQYTDPVYGTRYWENAFWNHYGEKEYFVWDQSIFFAGKINNVKNITESVWWPIYIPGPIVGDVPLRQLNPADTVRCHVYKISSDYTWSNDLKDWPYDFGAPVTENGLPKLYADQTVWTVYNALDTIRRQWLGYGLSKFPVTPLEIRQTAYAYQLDKADPGNYLNDIIFFEWEVINKGKYTIDSAVIGLWTDIDFYGPNNYPAIDTTLQLGYCWSNYNPDYKDRWDSSKIPAVGYVMLYGPSVPSSGETAVFKGNNKNNYKNLPLSAFWGFHDDSFSDYSVNGPAYSVESAWNIAHGLDMFGSKVIDIKTGKATTFRYSGDPVTNKGWLSNYNNLMTGGGAGFYMFSGNFTLAPNDTQWVMYAVTAARGGDNMKSVTELRKRASFLRNSKYQDLVKTRGLKYQTITEAHPEKFELLQNYPNPFNNSTTIRYFLNTGDNIRIELFNILGQKVKDLYAGPQTEGYHEIRLKAEEAAGGVYLYRILSETDKLSVTKKLIILN